jgi:hypothetical protein
MLLGLVGLALPVIIHLIARQRFPVLDFPSLRLLETEQRNNVFALQIVDLGQLLLRLLVLLLLVLAMSRLFAGCVSGHPAPRNLVVVLDGSASMQMKAAASVAGGPTTLFDLARSRAAEALSVIAPPSRCALVTAAEQTRVLQPLEPTSSHALACLEALRPTDGTGEGLVNAIAMGCDLVRGRRECQSQVLVFTDLRSTAFETRNQADIDRIQQARNDLGGKLDLVFVDLLTGDTANLAIVQAEVRGPQVKIGHDAHIVTRLVHWSPQPRETRIRLDIGDSPQPLVKSITIPADGEAIVDMTARMTRFVRTSARVYIQGEDGLPHDDSFCVPINVADPRRVLIVNGAAPETQGREITALTDLTGKAESPRAEEKEETIDGSRILRFALNPGQELGAPHGTGIQTTLITPEALPGQPLSKYELLILYDVSGLAESVLEDLDDFVRQGRSLLMICSGTCNAVQFNKTLAAATKKRAALAPVQLGHDVRLDPPAGIRTEGNRHPVLSPFRDPLQGDLGVVRFTRAREIKGIADTASVMLSGTGGQPLAVEMPLEQGRVVLLAFGLELDHSNLARTRVFPPLVWRLVDYLTGQIQVRPPDVLTALTPAVLDVSEPALAFAQEVELSLAETAPSETPPGETPAGGLASARRRFPISPDRTVLVAGMPAGRYLLHKPRPEGAEAPAVTYSRFVTVNPDARESAMGRIRTEQIPELCAGTARIVHPEEVPGLTPHGFEFWKSIALLLLLAYTAEALAAWWGTAQREKERAEGT